MENSVESYKKQTSLLTFLFNPVLLLLKYLSNMMKTVNIKSNMNSNGYPFLIAYLEATVGDASHTHYPIFIFAT